MLHYLQHQEIDKTRWDARVEEAGALVYNYSWFLDAVCPEWSCLTDDNYTNLLPLPVRKKWGIKYIFPPAFAQQTGIISPYEREFLSDIPLKFWHVTLRLRCSQILDIRGWNQELYQNYELDLHKSYTELQSAYAKNTRRNLNKAVNSNLQIVSDFPEEEYFKVLSASTAFKSYENSIESLKRLIKNSLQSDTGRISSVIDTQGQVHSALFWIHTPVRSYYLSPVSTEAGKESRAMFFMIDRIIEENAGTDHVLDFEGSNIESIARFYEGFNAKKILYLCLIRNRLPWPLKLMKP